MSEAAVDTFTFASASEVKTSVSIKVWYRSTAALSHGNPATNTLVEADWRATRKPWPTRLCYASPNCAIEAPT
jgi:hypothetical protein